MIGNHRLLWITLVGLLWLAGCSTNPLLEPPINRNISWETRSHHLNEIQNWNLKALVAIRTQQDSGSANLNWLQQQKNYTIWVFGPLGMNTVKLTGSPNGVALEAGKEKQFAHSPEALLQKQLGWNLPISNLYYWIRGLPVPGITATKQLDAYHHLIYLSQQNWQVRYLRYTAVNGMDMPSKIFLDNPALNVKLVIKEWQF